MRKGWIIIIILLVSLTLSGQTEEEKLAMELMEITGAKNIGMQIMDQLLTLQKKQFPEIPAEFWIEFKKQANVDDLFQQLIPLYTKYFTKEELEGLIEFYHSPLGRKLIEKQPLITQESFQIGYEWGQNMVKQVLDSLREKGYLK